MRYAQYVELCAYYAIAKILSEEMWYKLGVNNPLLYVRGKVKVWGGYKVPSKATYGTRHKD